MLKIRDRAPLNVSGVIFSSLSLPLLFPPETKKSLIAGYLLSELTFKNTQIGNKTKIVIVRCNTVFIDR